MIPKISTANPVNQEFAKNHNKQQKNNQVSFKSTMILDIVEKFKPMEKNLLSEMDIFVKNKINSRHIGSGLFANAYSLKKIPDIVIKVPKQRDSFEQEAGILKKLPAALAASQQFIARIADNLGNKYLISTKVNGEAPDPECNPWSALSLKSLFKNLFELDKAGIYHGDLNNGNLKIEQNGNVNFLDFQWGTQVAKSDFFSSKPTQCLPPFIQVQNSQMFEMAEIPYYVARSSNSASAKRFLKEYLNQKAFYHNNRLENINDLINNSSYYFNSYTVEKAKKFECAHRDMYRSLDNDTVKIEALKINFLSAFREAYKYLDPNTPEKNIIPAGSSYLYTLNSIQALRKEISDMKNSAYGTKLEYLNSMEDYADYWYNNLRDWTENAFRYPYRHTLNSLESWETLHNFDNPNIDIEKFDSMTNVVECVDKNFERNYTGNFHCEYTNLGDYMNRLNGFMKTAQNNYGTRNSKLFPSLKSAYERLYYAYKGERWLDVINTSLLLTRRAHEMTGYEGCYDLKYAASDVAQCVFEKVFDEMKDNGPSRYGFLGYKGMENFR